MTLIETLKNSLSQVDFSTVASLEVLVCGLIFHKLDAAAIDSLASSFASAGLWSDVSKVKRLAELNNYRSDQLDSITLQMLDNMDKIGALPANYTYDTSKYFIVDERCDLWLPKWAKEMGYRTDKWDAAAIFQDVKKCYDVYNRPFLYVNPEQNIVMPDSDDLVSLYLMAAQTLDCFVKLKAQGISGSIEYAVKAWDWVNQNLWQTDHYKDRTTANVLSGALNFHLIVLRLNAETKIGNFERILTDIDTKLLADRWNSPLWNNYAIVMSYPDDRTPSLVYSLSAFIMLHTIYPLLTTDMKTAFASMLSASTRAWEGLINYSGLYDAETGKFKLTPPHSVTDSATALGCILLLLQGIIPDTGCLAIPLIEDYNYDSLLMLMPKLLNLNISERKLTIPVFSGAIGFQFGEKLVSYEFASDGVWRVTFSSDWNRIVTVERIGNLPVDVKYVKTPTYVAERNIFQDLLNFLITFMVIMMLLSLITEMMRTD